MAILLIWMSIVPLTSSLTLATYLVPELSQINTWNAESLLVYFVIATILMALAITPTTFVAAVSGFLIGWSCIVPVVLAYQVASIFGYFLAKSMNNSIRTHLEDAYPTSQKYFNNLDQNQFRVTFLARISPALPFAIMNVVLSLAKIRFSTFFFGGFVGMLPRTVLFVLLGSQAQQLLDAASLDQNLFWLIVISAVTIFLMWKILKPQK